MNDPEKPQWETLLEQEILVLRERQRKHDQEAKDAQMKSEAVGGCRSRLEDLLDNLRKTNKPETTGPV